MELVILAWAPEMQILAVVQIEHWFPASSERPQEFPRRELPGMATGLLLREDIREGRRRTSGRGHPDRGCRSSRHDLAGGAVAQHRWRTVPVSYYSGD